MPIITDEEFGTITVRRSARARNVRIRVAPNGTLRASLPLYAPLLLVRRLLKTSRPKLRELLEDQNQITHYTDGMQIGKSHTLTVRSSAGKSAAVAAHGQQIIVRLPEGASLNDPVVSRKIRDSAIAALRKEAKSYLPRRLQFLAEKHGYSYVSVRFSHAGSRWGSCSSSGTISVNIALMKLPHELIDYVLVHELAHTRQMNHSQDFWQLVETADPDYRQHRSALKKETTSI